VSHRQHLELLQRGNTDRAVSIDLDDAIGQRPLQDQVPIVGDDHKLVQGWPANDGVEGEVDLCDVTDDALCAVVLRHLERD
jgi:hypothetical protein